MEVGFALPQYDYAVPDEEPLAWRTVLQHAVRAEAAGFDSVWLADHLFLSVEKYGGPAERRFGLDPLVALAGVARRTRRVRLGTLVLCTQLRPPAVLAKSLATLDVLSGGRAIAGMGAGWYEPEFADAGIAFERPGVRLQQLAEAIQIVRGMLGGGPFRFDGRHYQVHDAPCLPAAVQQPAPPIWVGGRGDRLLELVARHADGWNTVWTVTPDAYRARLGVLEAACERVGRDPATVTRSVGLYTLVGENEADLARRFRLLVERSPAGVVAPGLDLDAWREGHLVGTVDEVREQVAAWADLGLHTLVVCPAAVPFAVISPDDVELVATGVALR